MSAYYDDRSTGLFLAGEQFFECCMQACSRRYGGQTLCLGRNQNKISATSSLMGFMRPMTPGCFSPVDKTVSSNFSE